MRNKRETRDYLLSLLGAIILLLSLNLIVLRYKTSSETSLSAKAQRIRYHEQRIDAMKGCVSFAETYRGNKDVIFYTDNNNKIFWCGIKDLGTISNREREDLSDKIIIIKNNTGG